MNITSENSGIEGPGTGFFERHGHERSFAVITAFLSVFGGKISAAVAETPHHKGPYRCEPDKSKRDNVTRMCEITPLPQEQEG